MRTFIDLFSAYGFEPNAVTLVYGLAENSLGVTFPPLGQGVRVDHMKRDVFMCTGRAESALEYDSVVSSFSPPHQEV